MRWLVASSRPVRCTAWAGAAWSSRFRRTEGLRFAAKVGRADGIEIATATVTGTGTVTGVADGIASAVGAVAIGTETGVETVAVGGIMASGPSGPRDRNAQNQHGLSPMSRR